MQTFVAVFKREAAPHDHLRGQSCSRGGERGQAWVGIVCIRWHVLAGHGRRTDCWRCMCEFKEMSSAFPLVK